MGQTLTVPYFLTVVPSNESNFIQVHTKESGKQPQPTPPEEIEDYNLIIDTEWGQWSSCSTCDEVGKKHKIGYCVILLSEKHSHTPEHIQDGVQLLKVFQYGIPCNSHLLPNSIKSLPQVEKRKNELLIGYCKSVCPKPVIFEIIDRNGNVIEAANNSDGVYSFAQGPPPVEPEVQRTLIYASRENSVEIACPGSLNNDAPMLWQIGNLNVVPELLNRESNGRIFVSINDKIHIKKALVHDSNYYSCWQNGELAGVVQLVVERRIQMNFNHHIMLFGIIIILSTFIYVLAKAFVGRKHSKMGLQYTPKTPKNDLKE
ncbi:uncharacterized protein LOC126264486 [Aethina tumida]|uniref:uncharacterized protein LOC126264486 n=1 Tax=Aethina tumida TaxID=116153 RepID=UPI002147CF87|nr:uncharacterized protein LOC126264486 [Aethina tumida]